MEADLRWLPNSVLKDVPWFPKVEFIEDEGYGGYYCPDERLIVVSVAYESETVDSTIAHEYMHHLQFLRGIEFDYSEYAWKLLNSITFENYDRIIRAYFTNIDYEAEALWFETKIVKPKDHIEYWVKEIMR